MFLDMFYRGRPKRFWKNSPKSSELYFYEIPEGHKRAVGQSEWVAYWENRKVFFRFAAAMLVGLVGAVNMFFYAGATAALLFVIYSTAVGVIIGKMAAARSLWAQAMEQQAILSKLGNKFMQSRGPVPEEIRELWEDWEEDRRKRFPNA